MATRSSTHDPTEDRLDHAGPALLLGCMIGLAIFILFALGLAFVVGVSTL